MNKYLRALVVYPTGALKMGLNRLFHMKGFRAPLICQVSPSSELTLDFGARLSIGGGFKMRDGAKLRVRSGAVCSIGRNCSLNSQNMIACQNSVTIGDNVILSPNVQIYDHDHDYRCEGGIKEGKFITSPVVIGSNVWIGANCVILRGTKIGNNCVVAAGTIVGGEYPDNTLIMQERKTKIISREV